MIDRYTTADTYVRKIDSRHSGRAVVEDAHLHPVGSSGFETPQMVNQVESTHPYYSTRYVDLSGS